MAQGEDVPNGIRHSPSLASWKLRAPMQVTLTVPEEFATDDPAGLGRRIALYAALLMFRAGELSAGAAAEFAGVDRYEFADQCRRHDIPLVDYPADELRDEVESLRGRRPC